MAQAVDRAELVALLKGFLDVTPYRRGVRVDVGTVRVSIFPAPDTRRAATAGMQRQSSPRSSRPPPRGGTNSAGRRKANRAAARAGLPLPFPPPAVTPAADGNTPASGAAQASATQAEQAASTLSATASAPPATARPAAANAAPAPAAPAPAPPRAPLVVAHRVPPQPLPSSARWGASASEEPTPQRSLTGASAKTRTPPSLPAPTPAPASTPSLPPSRYDFGGESPTKTSRHSNTVAAAPASRHSRDARFPFFRG